MIACRPRTPPDAFSLEVPAPRQHPQSKTTVRVTYVPILLIFPFISLFSIHSPLLSYKPRTNSRPFLYPVLVPQVQSTLDSPPTSSSLRTPARQFIILSIYILVIPPNRSQTSDSTSHLSLIWFVLRFVTRQSTPLTTPSSLVYGLTFLLTDRRARKSTQKYCVVISFRPIAEGAHTKQ